MAGLVLWNRETGRPELVEGDQVQAALASGAYTEGPPEVTKGEGPAVTRDASNIGAAEAHGESATPAVAQKSVAAREAVRRSYVDTVADENLSYAEGVVDALSFGLVHDPSKTAELRRDVNSGYALYGEITGTVIGMETAGPTKALAGAGRRVGEKTAARLLGEAAMEGRGAIVARTAGGATEMAGLMAAGSVGHQFTDAVIGDKDFSAAAVVHEAGLGAIMGGTFNFLSGVFGRAASRYEIEAQGGLLDPASAESRGLGDHVDSALRGWNEVLDNHETRLGVLKALEADGALDVSIPEFMGKRELALAEARGALRDLAEHSFDDALNGDKDAWNRWHARMERASQKVEALDEMMRPKMLERLAPQEPGRPLADPGAPKTEQLGIPYEHVAEMDALMQDPARAAEYERLHGRPYEAQAGGGTRPFMENLGGEASPTSELKTPAATPRGLSESGPWVPEAPAGRFNPAEWTPARVQGEMGQGRRLTPVAEPDNRLNNLYEVQTKHVFPDGYFAPAADVEQNAQAFSQFQRRLANETPVAPVRYHGAADKIGQLGEDYYSGRNVYGEGFYTTSDEEIARSYQGKNKGANPRIYEVRESGPVKFYDLDAPLSPSAREALESGAKWSESAADALDDVQAGKIHTLGEAMDHIRRVSKEFGESRDVITDMFEGVKGRLQRDGFGGFTHEGGKLTGGKPHKVHIYWAPENQVNIKTKVAAAQAKPATPMAKGTPREAAPLGAQRVDTPVTRRTPMGPRTKDADMAISTKEEGRAAVRRYLDEWYKTAQDVGPKLSPGDVAAQNIRNNVNRLRESLAGREVAAQSLDLGKKLGLNPATTALGAELHGVYTMRQVAQLGAEASKGTAIAGNSKSRFLRWVAKRAGGKLGAAMVGGAIGHMVGGPLGYYVGASMAYKYMGFSGRAAGLAGRMMIKTVGAASKLLGKPAQYAALGAMKAGQLKSNPSANKPIAYSDLGPIKDPVARIADLRRIAASPPSIAAMVAKAAGDLNVVSPEFVASMVATATQQLQYLAMVAPQIQYDRLGRPMPPSAGELRKFLEAENAIFHLDQTLDAVGRGQVTAAQMDAFRNGHAAVYSKLAAFLLKDPEALQQLERAKLRTIEMVTGVPLTPGSDPAFLMRQQEVFMPEMDPQAQAGSASPQPAQALSIGAGRAPSDLPSAKPLPSQSANGRAPGN